MTLTQKIATMAAAIAVASAGALAVDASHAPAANAACYSQLTASGAYNSSCRPKMRHWVVTRPQATHYGPTVTPGKWSKQLYCYANVASRGVTVLS